MSEFVYDIEYEANRAIIKLSGKINEDTPLSDIFDDLKDDVKEINFDLSKIIAMNSYGVRLWINTFSEFSNKYTYVFSKIPVILVNQINMIYNFLPKNALIESFFSPFYCENCDDETDILLNFNELNITEDKVDFGNHYCKECGGELEFDEMEDEYFSFYRRYNDEYIIKNKQKGNIVLSNMVIAVEDHEQFSSKLKEYLEGKGYNVTVKPLLKDETNLLDLVDDDTNLLVCGYKEFDNTFNAIKELKEEYSNLKIVILTQEDLANLLVKDWVDVFYPDNIITFVLDETDKSLVDIGIVADKLLSNDIFGLDKYVDVKNVQINEIIIKDATEKNLYINKLLDFASNVGIKYRLMSNIESIADEMIMNAIYNAPVDENGNDKYASIDRKTKVSLNENEYAKLKYAYDGEKFLVSVKDNFGRLTKDKILSYLKKCFMDPENQVEDKDGGAGLGLYLIYKQVHQFIVNIEKNKQTEVIAIFFPHKRKKNIINKLFHIFIKNNELEKDNEEK